MSWSVGGIGKPAALAAKFEAELRGYRCVEPEEQVKDAVINLIKVALEAQDPSCVVRVSGSGSQSMMDYEKKTFKNYLNLVIEPICALIE